jgi:hypothetical protein
VEARRLRQRHGSDAPRRPRRDAFLSARRDHRHVVGWLVRALLRRVLPRR